MNKLINYFSQNKYTIIFIPIIIIIVALMTSYILFNTTSLFSGEDYKDDINSKHSNINGKLPPGLYKDSNNNTWLYTYSGKSVSINNQYYQIIRNYLQSVLMGDNNASGCKDVDLNSFITRAESVKFYTNQYSEIILAIDDKLKEVKTIKYLNNLGNEGVKISNIENNLLKARFELAKNYYEFKIAENVFNDNLLRYQQLRKSFLNKNVNPALNKDNALNSAYTNLIISYVTYRNASKNYKDSINKNYSDVLNNYKSLNKATYRFNNILLVIIQDTSIPEEAKTIILTLCDEIKFMNNSVLLNEFEELDKIVAIRYNYNDLKESFDRFKSIDITMNFENFDNIKCIANCKYKNGSNCYKKCSFNSQQK